MVKNGSFSNEKADFNIIKIFFPENTLMYANNGYISTVKSSELAIYIHNFIIGQLIVAANSPENIDDYVCQEKKVKLIIPLYSKETAEF